MKSRTKKTKVQMVMTDLLEGTTEPQNHLFVKSSISSDFFEGMERMSGIQRTFRMMELAEDVLREKWPDRKDEPRYAFKLALPTVPVRISEMLIRAHLEELFSRFDSYDLQGRWDSKLWKSLARLTRAEVIGLLVEASFRHPLQHRDCILYETLFVELFPGKLSVIESRHRDPVETQQTIREWLYYESPERSEWIREIRKEEKRAARPPG